MEEDDVIDYIKVIPKEELEGSLLVLQLKDGVYPSPLDNLSYFFKSQGINASVLIMNDQMDTISLADYGIKDEDGKWINGKDGIPICGSQSQMFAHAENNKMQEDWTVEKLPKKENK